MGTWGTGAFENDDAADWAGELEEADEQAVRKSLETADGAGADDYLEAPEGQIALAAAEVVAAAMGRPAPDLPAEIASWVSSRGAAAAGFAELAARAVRRVMSANSELRDLWSADEGADQDDVAEWETRVRDLEQRLGTGSSS